MNSEMKDKEVQEQSLSTLQQFKPNYREIPPLPEEPETQLRGFKALWDNPYYLELLRALAVEEAEATNEAFFGEMNSKQHFVEVGKVQGLVRIKALHLSLIDTLTQSVNGNNNNSVNENE